MANAHNPVKIISDDKPRKERYYLSVSSKYIKNSECNTMTASCVIPEHVLQFVHYKEIRQNNGEPGYYVIRFVSW